MTEYRRNNISRVAVTGGSGFVGNRLVKRLLAEGHAVRLLTRDKSMVSSQSVEVFHGDLLDTDNNLDEFLNGVDVLFHCAGEVRDEGRMQALNVDATARLLDAARGRQLHWIQLSSVGVYGAGRSGTVTEDSALAPANSYKRSKAAADSLLMSVRDEEPMTWSILRPANIFGEGMSARGLGRMVRAIKRGIFLPIGDGKSTVHYIYIDNVIDALLLCMQDKRAVGRIYNISDTNSMDECAGIIAEFYGRHLGAFSIPHWLVRFTARLFLMVPGFPLSIQAADALTGKICFSRTTIENELGYNLHVPLKKGMHLFLKWEENGQASV